MKVLVILGDPGSGKTTLARFITQKVAINFKNKILQRTALNKTEAKENKGSEGNEKSVNNNNEENGEKMSVESSSEESDEGESESNHEHEAQNAEENQENDGEDESATDAMEIDGEDSVDASSAEANSVPVNKKKYRKNPQEAMEDDLKTLESGAPKFPVLVRVSEYSEARAKEPELKLIDFLGFHSWLGK